MASETTTAAAGDAATHAADAAGQVAEKVGMPQLDFATFPNQIFWLVVTLVVLYLILSRVALPRIAGVLADRQGVITNDIAAAEELKNKAEAAEKSFNQAIADARADAAKIVAEARAAIQVDLNKASAKADAEIAARVAESEVRIGEVRAGALAAVDAVAKDTAVALVAALGGQADAKTVAAAVAARMKG